MDAAADRSYQPGAGRLTWAYAGVMAVSKRVIIPVRVPEDVAQKIDSARGGQSRSGWVSDLIDAALTETDAPPKKTNDAPKERRSGCPHPRARVIKGFCYACGKPAAI